MWFCFKDHYPMQHSRQDSRAGSTGTTSPTSSMASSHEDSLGTITVSLSLYIIVAALEVVNCF